MRSSGRLRFVALLTVGFTAGAGDTPTSSALSGLQAWLDGTRTLSGRFEQTLVSGALGTGIEEYGRIWVARPGRLRWDYLEPERKVAIVDGARARLWIEADRQLWEGPLDDSSAILSVLLTGDRRLETLFVAETIESTHDRVRLRLGPRAGEVAVEDLVLTLDPQSWAIEEAEVLDPAGNRMRFRFSSLKRNAQISAARFQFEPPPGTEIVGHP